MTFGRNIGARALTPLSIPTLGPRDAIVETLAEYLRCAKFRVWGGEAEDRDITLQAVTTEWPRAGVDLLYPSASIIEQSDTYHESGLTPYPLEDTLGVFDGLCGNGPNDPATVLWKHAEAQAMLQVDFWCSNSADRQAIEAELSAVFTPSEGRYGVLLGGHPRYFSRPVRCTLLKHRRVDTGTTAYANERRLQCAIRAEVDIVRLYRAQLSALTLATDAIDPSDPPTEEPPQ